MNTSLISLRQHIATDITNISPFDSLETTHQKDALDWIDSGANLFRVKKPDVPPKHLVSYFVLVDPTHHSMLLVDHINAQLWLPTGGHVLPNETPADAVVREADEELHIKTVFLKSNPKPFFITVTPTGGLTPGHTDVSLWYLLRGNKHAFIHYDKSEFTDVEWWSFDEILEADSVIFDPHLQRFTKKLADYLA